MLRLGCSLIGMVSVCISCRNIRRVIVRLVLVDHGMVGSVKLPVLKPHLLNRRVILCIVLVDCFMVGSVKLPVLRPHLLSYEVSLLMVFESSF